MGLVILDNAEQHGHLLSMRVDSVTELYVSVEVIKKVGLPVALLMNLDCSHFYLHPNDPVTVTGR